MHIGQVRCTTRVRRGVSRRVLDATMPMLGIFKVALDAFRRVLGVSRRVLTRVCNVSLEEDFGCFLEDPGPGAFSSMLSVSRRVLGAARRLPGVVRRILGASRRVLGATTLGRSWASLEGSWTPL